MTDERQPRPVRRALLLLTVFGILCAGIPWRSARASSGDDDVVSRAVALLRRVTPLVEAAVGAPFPSPPRVVTLTAREAERVFRADLRDEVARRHPEATAGQRATLLAASARSSVASCIARYSFTARAIVLVRPSFDAQRATAGFAADEAEDLLVAVLAHEAVHALDDAHHDLARLFREAPDAEALRARAMVAEGRAVFHGRRAAAAAGASEKARALLPGGGAPQGLHTWLLRLTYEGGASFAAALAARAERNTPQKTAADLAERLFAHPPRTTHELFHPASWPRGAPDARPARIVGALPDATVQPLSELQLRARYAALHDGATAARLFAGFRGGAQSLVDATNAAVLAFESEDGARAYVEIAEDEAPTERSGTLVLRAFGPAADALMKRLREAATATADD